MPQHADKLIGTDGKLALSAFAVALASLVHQSTEYTTEFSRITGSLAATSFVLLQVVLVLALDHVAVAVSRDLRELVPMCEIHQDRGEHGARHNWAVRQHKRSGDRLTRCWRRNRPTPRSSVDGGHHVAARTADHSTAGKARHFVDQSAEQSDTSGWGEYRSPRRC